MWGLLRGGDWSIWGDQNKEMASIWRKSKSLEIFDQYSVTIDLCKFTNFEVTWFFLQGGFGFLAKKMDIGFFKLLEIVMFLASLVLKKIDRQGKVIEVRAHKLKKHVNPKSTPHTGWWGFRKVKMQPHLHSFILPFFEKDRQDGSFRGWVMIPRGNTSFFVSEKWFPIFFPIFFCEKETHKIPVLFYNTCHHWQWCMGNDVQWCMMYDGDVCPGNITQFWNDTELESKEHDGCLLMIFLCCVFFWHQGKTVMRKSRCPCWHFFWTQQNNLLGLHQGERTFWMLTPLRLTPF